MIQCGCEFCNDMENIKPAKYVKCTNVFHKRWLEEAMQNKKFIIHFSEIIPHAIVNVCPKCGHRFTEEDYDNYKPTNVR